MRYGFKAFAKRLALEIRSEFQTCALGPFDPYAYFREYGLPVVTLGSLDGVARDHFYRQVGSQLSGALIPNGTGFVILDNDAHALTRRRATMAHEIAHHALDHDFEETLAVSERKCGIGGDQEQEADYLAGELLIPTENARKHAFDDWTDERVAREYEVSIKLARWRMNGSGARKIAERARQRRGNA
ncbi:MAG: ImmA/IrrE family metallo-endopeptidase [Cryobacterium sp.]|nr:ImmA/IrrE family metallo-endopeptidase [Cryobacterium sp.]